VVNVRSGKYFTDGIAPRNITPESNTNNTYYTCTTPAVADIGLVAQRQTTPTTATTPILGGNFFSLSGYAK
jgi:hypothetical protein